MRFVFGLLVTLLVFTPSVFADPAPQTVAGTPIALTPPAGFKPAKDFSGFINPQTDASILVIIFPPETAEKIAAVFEDAEQFTAIMKTYNFTITGHETAVTSTGLPITVYSGTQKDGDTSYDKWATMVSAEGISGQGFYMITLQAPASAQFSAVQALAVFRSIEAGAWNSLKLQVAALPFTYETLAPFQTKAALMGAAVTLEAASEPDSADKPVTLYIIRDTQPYLSATAQQLQTLYLASIRQVFTIQTITQEKTVTFARYEGRRLAGTGKDNDGNIQDIILYTALDSDSKMIYLQALGKSGTLTPLVSTIDAIARSVVLKTD
ncbi:MAG: Signal peptide protein [Candidatus Tokpelaia hoelldobleri]|uniref:Signal peptide protein n=1 Tax=Candidatus Tokpelaia hoelldobleri TaxID=1902579 RepID=A0A1U9JSE7_9HYPH|nr:MAG: Signal peptide protein [Candidatus Tokpelaia hoelldoblerii]